MTTIGKLFWAAGIALAAVGIGSNAEATVLSTSPVWADPGQSTHSCNIVNKSANILPTVKVQLVTSGGNVALERIFDNIGPGTSRELFPEPTPSGFATCRFTLPLEFVGTVRANISVFHDAGGYLETIAFDIAR